MIDIRASLKKFFAEWVLGDIPSNKQPSPTNLSNSILRSYGMHQIFGYDMYDPDNGLFFNEGSIGFCMEVIPQTGANEEMITRLLTMFTPIPAETSIQIQMFGNTIFDGMIERYYQVRREAQESGNIDSFGIELAEKRIDHIMKNVGQPLYGLRSNYSIKKPTLVISVTRDGDMNNQNEIEIMSRLKHSMLSALRQAELAAFHMDVDALITHLTIILDPQTLFNRDPLFVNEYDEHKQIKEQITKISHTAHVERRAVVFGSAPEKGEKDERVAMRSYGITRYPKQKTLWEMGEIIGAMFDNGLQYPCPYILTCGIYTLDANQTETMARVKHARAKQNSNSSMAKFQPEYGEIEKDWESVVWHTNNGGAMCEVYHLISVFAPLDKIDTYGQTVLNIWSTNKFSIIPLDFIQLGSLYMSCPMTLNKKTRDDLKKLKLITTKTTINAIDMSPLIGEWQGVGDPIVMLFGRKGTPCFIDFYANTDGNYNLYVCGVSGAGKSVLLLEILAAYRATGAQLFILDVGRSFKNFVDLAKGTTFDFNSERRLCMNPWSWLQVAETEESSGLNTFQQELQMLLPIYAKMASPRESLNQYQTSLLAEALTETWLVYGNQNNVDNVQSYLLQIKDQSGVNVDRTAFELGKQLQPFTTKGMYGNYFNGEANISFENDVIYLELEELKSAPDLRAVVMFCVTSRIMKEMYLSRDRRKLCFIDEAWQLLGDDAETAKFIEEGYRRARKYNGIFGIGTQGIEDAFKNEASRAAYNNADWKIFLRQDEKNFQQLIDSEKISFSPYMQKLIKSLRKENGMYAEMIISSPRGEHLLRHIPDDFSLAMASTNAKDYTRLEQLMKGGMTTIQAIDQLLKDKEEAKRGYSE
jgi:conjugal transfer ATP-binding protein TraC